MLEYFEKYKEICILVITFLSIVIVSYTLIVYFRYLIIKRVTSKIASTETKLDDLFLKLFESIKRYFIATIAIYIGLLQVDFTATARININKVFILITIFQISQLASVVITFFINKRLKSKSENNLELASTINLLSLAIKMVVYSILFLVALNNLGVDVTALIAGLGVGGIAVALALQNILTDLFSSLTIVLDKPFIVGDFIVIDELSGTIENIGLKTTRLKSISGEQLIFGNTDLLKSRIKNYKRMKERRILQNLTVTYQTSSEQLEVIPEMIKTIIESVENTRFDRCHFLRFQDSSLEFELVYWVLSPEFNKYADCAQSINLKIFKEFNKNKIDFAYPTQTLFITKENPEIIEN